MRLVAYNAGIEERRMSKRFAVIGSGAWGTTVAMLLAQKPDHQVCLWSYRPELTQQLRETRENTRLLPGVRIPQTIEFEHDIRAASDGSALWIAAVPTVYLRSTLEKHRSHFKVTCPVLSLCKGLEIGTFQRPSQIVREILGVERLAVLSGPSHAEEVARGLPASVVAASDDAELAKWIQICLNSDHFRIYTNSDVIGVEYAAALKNIIAIAAGICDGLHIGDNAKAALLTRGLVEMARFGVAHGAEEKTFHGLAGMGDLITTCMSKHGRNRAVGQRLATGEKLADIIASTEMVAEGVYTARSVYEESKKRGIDMPIVEQVYCVLYEGKSPKAAVEDLMHRTAVAENRIKA
jgi:glycerol-3-phosphate dehydrogenase (NAD(P)+)